MSYNRIGKLACSPNLRRQASRIWTPLMCNHLTVCAGRTSSGLVARTFFCTWKLGRQIIILFDRLSSQPLSSPSHQRRLPSPPSIAERGPPARASCAFSNSRLQTKTTTAILWIVVAALIAVLRPVAIRTSRATSRATSSKRTRSATRTRISTCLCNRPLVAMGRLASLSAMARQWITNGSALRVIIWL